LLPHDTLQLYEQRGVRKWHLPLIREYLGITAFGDGGRRVLVGAMIDASKSKDILADIINVGIEILVQERYELPAFSRLRRAAQAARAQVNQGYYQLVYDALDDHQRQAITALLSRDDQETTSSWQRLKREPRQPTPKRIREHLAHARWLQSLNTARHAVDGISETKLQRFADEARALNVTQMNRYREAKRATLAVTLTRVRTAQALDDLAEMFIRLMQKMHHKAKEALDAYRREHQEQTDALVSLLSELVGGWQKSETSDEQLKTISALIGEGADKILEQCEAHLAYAGNNYLPFLLPLLRAHRKLFFDILEFLEPMSTSTDKALEQAITFILRHRHAKAARLSIIEDGPDAKEILDISWIPPRWWKAVTGRHRRDVPVLTVDRKYLELCVLSCVVTDLKSCDLYIEGSEEFSDYRDQQVTWEEYAQLAPTFCAQVGISPDPETFVQELQTWGSRRKCREIYC
jgi:hypothetical protein